MSSTFASDYNVSVFNEVHSTLLACRTHEILNAPVNWLTAHREPNYLEMVNLRYRTFYLECNKSQIDVKLPTIFEEEFGTETHKYNMLVDRFGNRFEVIIEKRGDNLCFTHGWSQITNCYLTDDVPSGWVYLTYIRPKLFVVIVADRYYRDVFGSHVYSDVCSNLSRSLFGRDEYPIRGLQVRLPYRHDDRDFAHMFIMKLTESDVYSGFLTMGYEHFADKLFAKDAAKVELVDEIGLQWKCTIEYVPHPSDHIKIGGEWLKFIKAKKYKVGTYLIFGTRSLPLVWELFVKES